MSYQKEANGTLKVLEENNYYPFGLKHQGYNNTNLANANYKYKYQGQERQDELGLNWDSFKWRNYMPEIGRFFNVDPLAEQYAYNGVYNFSENRVIDGRELEGLEWKSIKDENTGNTKLQLTIQLYNQSSLNNNQLEKRIEGMKSQFAESYSGYGYVGELIVEPVTEKKGGFLAVMYNYNSSVVDNEDGTITTSDVNGSAPNSLESVNTQSSDNKSTPRIKLSGTINGSARSVSGMSRTVAHEAGHTAGLRHTHDSKNQIKDVNQNTPGVSNKTLRNNLMNSNTPNSKVPTNNGTKLTESQLKNIDEKIKIQQK